MAPILSRFSDGPNLDFNCLLSQQRVRGFDSDLPCSAGRSLDPDSASTAAVFQLERIIAYDDPRTMDLKGYLTPDKRTRGAKLVGDLECQPGGIRSVSRQFGVVQTAGKPICGMIG